MVTQWDELAPFRERRRAWIDAAGAPVTDWLIDALALEAVAVTWRYENADEYIAIEVDRPDARGDFLRALGASGRDRAVRLAAELLEPFWVDGAYIVPGETLNVLAVRPSELEARDVRPPHARP